MVAQTGVLAWAQNEAANATADSRINWQEGQAPSSINDSARAMMGAVAKWRDDINGILTTSGTGTAYTVASNQVLSNGNQNGATFQFTPGTTNTGAVTLSVDGQTAKPIRFRTGIDLPAGVLISGSLYQVTYRSASQEWLLHAFDSSVYAVPIGSSMEFWGANAPNGAFVIPRGQAISRTTFSALFNIFGVSYGAGDGSTTFNLPNPMGRVLVQQETSPNLLTSSFFGADSTVIGNTGGGESIGLSQANLPSVNFSVTSAAVSVLSTVSDIVRSTFGVTSSTAATGGSLGQFASSGGNTVAQVGSSGTVSGQTASSGGSGSSFRTVQPTLICNRIMRII